MPAIKKLILVVIDGLTPSMLEDTLERGTAPALALLAAHGRYRRAISTFPSLTPVCLSALATGAHPDVHEIPHLVWYHRGEQRLVEYGSSFGAVRAAGTKQSLVDTVYGLNASHLGRNAVTVYEALEDAGLTAAAVNITCYRGRHPHVPTVPFLTRPAYGPSRFFFYNLFESDVTGAPLSVRNRPRGTIDAYASAVGRWLVTRDGFDFLVFYLSDYDYASHAVGPDAAHSVLQGALARCDDAVGALIEAAGGADEFLERYAVILCADHGQTQVSEVARLEDTFPDVLVTASNRAAMVYADKDVDPAQLALRLDGNDAVDVVLYREGDEAVARRDGAELRFTPSSTSGDPAILDHPQGLERAWAALANPNAGELIISAAAGWEFADLAGRHHAGGGSHGSLLTGDSEVPMLTVGLETMPDSIVEVMPAVLDHFGVAAPAYARTPART